MLEWLKTHWVLIASLGVGAIVLYYVFQSRSSQAATAPTDLAGTQGPTIYTGGVGGSQSNPISPLTAQGQPISSTQTQDRNQSPPATTLSVSSSPSNSVNFDTQPNAYQHYLKDPQYQADLAAVNASKLAAQQTASVSPASTLFGSGQNTTPVANEGLNPSGPGLVLPMSTFFQTAPDTSHVAQTPSVPDSTTELDHLRRGRRIAL